MRATSTIARTLYRQFVDSGADDSDIIAFVNEVMELLIRSKAGDLHPDRGSLVDAETGLPSGGAIRELMAFELRRSHTEPRREVACGLVTVSIPETCPTHQHVAVHSAVAASLRERLRAFDIVGRWKPSQYVVLLRGLPEAAHVSLAERLASAIASTMPCVPGLHVGLQFARPGTHGASPEQVVDACAAASLIDLYSGAANDGPRASKQPDAHARGLVLALGGGAARAAAHIGLLQVLEENDIPIAGIAGTSAGALVGAMYSIGRTPSEMLERFESLPSALPFQAMRSGLAARGRRREGAPIRSRDRSLPFVSDDSLSITDQATFEAFVAHFVGRDRDIRATRLPFVACATDLVEGCATPLARGSLHDALLASCAVPGLFPPQSLDDRILIDGSTLAEVPVAAALQLARGAPVVAVYLGGTTARRSEFRTSREVAGTAAKLAESELVREQLTRADALVSMPVQDVGWLGFHHAARIAAIGRDATTRSLPELRRRLERLGPPLRLAEVAG